MRKLFDHEEKKTGLSLTKLYNKTNVGIKTIKMYF